MPEVVLPEVLEAERVVKFFDPLVLDEEIAARETEGRVVSLMEYLGEDIA